MSKKIMMISVLVLVVISFLAGTVATKTVEALTAVRIRLQYTGYLASKPVCNSTNVGEMALMRGYIKIDDWSGDKVMVCARAVNESQKFVYKWTQLTND